MSGPSGTYRTALRDGIATLRAAGIEGAERDARLLLAHQAGVPADRLTLLLADPLPEAAEFFYPHLLADRANGMPVSRILGHRLFWGRRFAITADTLDPRPETECIVALALERPFADVLDLGTGSGILAVTLLAERPGAAGIATDISRPALEVAARNARAHGVADRLALEHSDWFTSVGGQYDLIVSNPPYIAEADLPGLAREVRDHDPRIALTDEGDGLSAYRAIAAEAGLHLRAAGRLLVECGAGQAGAVAEIFRAAGLDGVAAHDDLDGRPRVISAEKPGQMAT